MKAQVIRNSAIRSLRHFFASRGFIEVRTEKSVIAGAMEPYIDTFLITGEISGYTGALASSPEFAMKKVFAAEMQASPAAAGIYEISPVFRDDRAGKLHRTEFTMVEWYAKGTGVTAIVQQAADLVQHLAAHFGLAGDAQSITGCSITELFRDAGVRPDFSDPAACTKIYRELHGKLPHHLNDLDCEIACFNLLFDELLLPGLRHRPALTAVHGFPECVAALAQVRGGTAQRTEIFANGIELANAYDEEFDAQKVEKRWLAYNEIRRLRGVPEHPVDRELLASLSAMEHTAGIAVGLERLLAWLMPEYSLQ